MADKDLSFRVNMRDDASRGFERLASTAKRALKGVDDSLDETSSNGKRVARALSAMADEIDDEFRGAEQAAERLSDALGSDFADKASASVDQLVADLRRAGLTFDEIEADADELAAAIKKMDDVSQRASRSAASSFDGVGRSARGVGDEVDRTRGVVANFAGNAVQDIPGVAGSFGALNVAVGQFAEYASEGDIKLKNFAKAALPLLALSVAIAKVNSELQEAARRAEHQRKQVEDLTDSLTEGKSAAEALTDQLVESGEVSFGGDDFLPHLNALGLSLQQFTSLAAAGESAIQRWRTEMIAGGADAGTVELAVFALTQKANQLGEAEENAAIKTTFFGDAAVQAAASNRDLAAAHESAAAAAERQATANHELLDSTLAQFDASIGLASAQRETANAFQDATAAVDDETTAADEVADAQDRAASAALRQAQAAVRLAQEQARASGQTLSAESAADTYIWTLSALANQLAPGSALRVQLEGYISQLARADRDITNTITTVYKQTGAGPGGATFRALGGPVKEGNPYIVGERGEELFVPEQDGQIIPNDKLRNGSTATAVAGVGGGLTIIVQNLNVATTIDTKTAGPAIMDALEREARVSGKARIRRLAS